MKTIDLRKFEFVLAFIIGIALLCSGCGGSNTTPPNPNNMNNPNNSGSGNNNTNPSPTPSGFQVITTLPQGDDAGLDAKFGVTFNRAIADTPLTVTVTDLDRNLEVPLAEILPDANREGLTIVPDLNRMIGSTRYRVSIRGLESVDGERLANDEYSWEFTTGRPQGDNLTHAFTLPSASEALGIAIDERENRYVVGSLLVERENAQSDTDAMIAMIDASGAVVWQRLFASDSVEYANAVTVGADGAIYVAGVTNGSLERANAGSYDLFAAKYNAYGVREWIIQSGEAGFDQANAVAYDANSGVVYVAGSMVNPANSQTNGLLFLFYPEQGRRVTLQIANTSSTALTTVATDMALASNGEVYVTGYTSGSLPNYSGGVRNGNHANAGNGTPDAFWYRYNPQGIGIRDTVQFGTAGGDLAKSIALKETASDTRVIVAGHTDSALYGPAAGSLDLFVAQYLPSTGAGGPVLESSLQAGTAGYDDVFDLIANPAEGTNEYYMGGVTTGAFTGFTAQAVNGDYDAFVTTVSFDDTVGTLELRGLRQTQDPFSQVVYGLALSPAGGLSAMANTNEQPGSGLGTIAYYHDFYRLPIIVR